MPSFITDAHARRDNLARLWRVTIDESFETASSIVAYGRRAAQPVVLKVIKRPGDEWSSGDVLNAFGGRGVARAHEYVDGGVLLERLEPGHSLVELALSGHDEEATAILADVIAAMSPSRSVPRCPTLQDWGKSFKWYGDTGDGRVPGDLVTQAEALYAELCTTQTNPRLLHGDLQHYNVLFDRRRGWLSIDPKGVFGEIEYEVGALLRNPWGRADVFADPSIIERRLGQLASKLNLDAERALAWAFAQSVLSAIWGIEDGSPIDAKSSPLLLAAAIRPMLPSAN